MKKRISLHIAVAMTMIIAAASCRMSGTSTSDSHDADTLHMKYARNIVIVRHADFTQVDVRDPWHEGNILHTYLLVERGKRLPNGLKRNQNTDIVPVPVTRSIVTTAPHCQLICWLGATNAIKGVCDAEYIHVEELQFQTENNKKTKPQTANFKPQTSNLKPQTVMDCGNSMQPMIEKIVEVRPQILLLSPFENSGGYGRLAQTGIPIIECADYMEPNALGRAEWMRFYGMLFGRQKQADSLFNVVERNYLSLRNKAQKLRKGRSILTERKTGSVWYCPGGHSTVAQIIRDANGKYAFNDDDHSGSLALPFEQVLAKAADTQVWAFKINGQKPLSKADLLAEYHGYSAMQAFRSGEIYQCNCMIRPYFEQISFRPDWLLQEFIILLHPEQQSFGKLRYYEKLSE